MRQSHDFRRPVQAQSQKLLLPPRHQGQRPPDLAIGCRGGIRGAGGSVERPSRRRDEQAVTSRINRNSVGAVHRIHDYNFARHPLLRGEACAGTPRAELVQNRHGDRSCEWHLKLFDRTACIHVALGLPRQVVCIRLHGISMSRFCHSGTVVLLQGQSNPLLRGCCASTRPKPRRAPLLLMVPHAYI